MYKKKRIYQRQYNRYYLVNSIAKYRPFNSEYKQCIPFEGYEDLVGTTISPDSIYPA